MFKDEGGEEFGGCAPTDRLVHLNQLVWLSKTKTHTSWSILFPFPSFRGRKRLRKNELENDGGSLVSSVLKRKEM